MHLMDDKMTIITQVGFLNCPRIVITKHKKDVINVRENRRCNQERLIQRDWQHKTQDTGRGKKTQHRKLRRLSTRAPSKIGSEPRHSRKASGPRLLQDNYNLIHACKCVSDTTKCKQTRAT